MLDFRVAQQLLASQARSFGKERVSLLNAQGRVLSENIFSDRDYPPFNRATMDGYALRYDDLQSGKKIFNLVETIFAGQESHYNIVTGECYKIMTGAAVPEAADLVIRREDSLQKDAAVTITSSEHRRYQNIAQQGEDTKQGERVIHSPITCSPAVISVLAAMGKKNVLVESLPRVSLFTTGNEIRGIDEVVNAHQIRNSNRFLLEAMLKKWDIIPQHIDHVPDNPELLEKQFNAALSTDIILVSGAVSAGDADFVPAVMEKIGLEKIFHKLSIKPGKPMWCGRHKNGCMVFALPGNPFSSLVTFVLMVEYYLSQCFATGDSRKVTLPLSTKKIKKSTLDEFFPVRIDWNIMKAVPIPFNSSGDILAAMHADGIAHQPAIIQEMEEERLVEVWRIGHK